ncbi:MAG TPA: hypothetical protein VEZ72_10045, partial [Paenibacillus sp.]|nr:hypothetical protein [Paenibacillus sp.]
MRRKIRGTIAVTLSFALCASSFASLLAPETTRAETTASRVVFDDALGQGFIDHSWADHALDETSIVRGGTRSIRLNPSMGNALYLYSTQYMLTSQYNMLEFYIHGGTANGGQQLNVLFQAGGKDVALVDLDDYLEAGKLLPNEWQKVQIYLPPLRMPHNLFDGILLVDASKGAQSDVFVDDVRLTYETVVGSQKPPKPVREQIVAYDEEVKAGFLLFGNAYADPKEETVVRTGEYSLRITPTDYNGAYLYRETPPGAISTTEYVTLEFWYNDGPAGGQQLDLVFKA